MEPFPQRIGAALQRLRKVRGVSPSELTRRCGVEASTLAAYESGRRGMQTDTLGRLLDAIGANLCDLHTVLSVQLSRPADLPTGSALAGLTAVSEGGSGASSLIGDSEALGLALQLMRERRRLDIGEVADRLGVEPATAWGYEAGKALRLSTLDRLFATYGANFLDLHANLVVAQFLRAWKQGVAAGQAEHLRAALLCLGLPHPGTVSEGVGIRDLRVLRSRLVDQAP